MHAQAVLQRDARRAAGLPPLPVDSPDRKTVSPLGKQEEGQLELSDQQTTGRKDETEHTIDLTMDSPPKSSAVIDLVSPTLKAAAGIEQFSGTAAEQLTLPVALASAASASLALKADDLDPVLFGNVLSQQDTSTTAPPPPVSTSSELAAAVPTSTSTDEAVPPDFLSFLNIPTPSSTFPTNAANTPSQQPPTTANTPLSSAQAPTALTSAAATGASMFSSASSAPPVSATTTTPASGMADLAGLFGTSGNNNNSNPLDTAGGATPVDFAALLASLPADPSALASGNGGDNASGYGSPVGDTGLGSGLDLEEFLKSLGGGDGQ
jgi:hypothetical protein